MTVAPTIRSVAAAFDAAASNFERHRGFPDGVAASARGAVLAALAAPRPRLLEVGAGTGRVGRAFVEAGDDYVGLDLSAGMLGEFRRRAGGARLVRADGGRMPFADAAFDAVVLSHVLAGAGDWRPLVDEALRVLAPSGALILGRTVAPDDGMDAAMKRRLRDLGLRPVSGRRDAERYLGARASSVARCAAATWTARTSAHRFLERQRSGARFAALPQAVREASLAALADWAAATLGPLDAMRLEPYAFELQVFTFGSEAEN